MKTPLPIDSALPEIVRTVAREGRLVLQAPPGAGKTTRVPVALLDIVRGRVVVLEPRRLAARLAARRVAEERGERVGDTVGYEVRFERAASPSTRLLFVTEGILTRRLIGDPDLSGVSAVVLDEFHERHLQADVALSLLRRLRASKRPDLQIVVMSATLDALPVAAFLGDAPVVSSRGRQFDVVIEHLPAPDDRPLESQVASAVRDLLVRAEGGDILVFLPGAAEIRRAMDRCARLADEADLLLVPLHGDLPLVAQDLALRRAERKKVVFSTNVAETSVTIEGVTAVVDSGLARVARHNPWSGRSTLEIAKISRASAAQRAGRAGRTGPGRALRLYTRGDHDARAEHDTPEIERADLSETVLMLHATGARDLGPNAWLTPPPRGAIEGAEQLLQRLGALGPGGEVTELGRRMVGLPLPPRLARIAIEADARGALDEGCVVAAILAEGRDVYARGWDEGAPDRGGPDEASDLLARMYDVLAAIDGEKVDRDRARALGLDPAAVASVHRARRQILHGLRRQQGARADRQTPESTQEALCKAILSAYPDRVARRRTEPGADGRLGTSRDLLLCTGGRARLAQTSVVGTAPWLVAVEAAEVGGAKQGAKVWLASAIEPEWLIDLGATESLAVRWNAELERVDAVERLSYERLVIDERPAGPCADEQAAALLAERVLAVGVRALVDADAFDRLSSRIGLVVSMAPDLASAWGIAPLDDATLRRMLTARIAGKRSFAELRDGALLDDVRAAIGRRALARLDELAPEHLVLRGGRRVKVSYAPDQPPSVASRLQDFFGCSDTPRILDGRCPVVLHLLAPSGRDVQITTDLAGFWARTYPAVRTELMRRYPRHAWPEDPLRARPAPPKGGPR